MAELAELVDHPLQVRGQLQLGVGAGLGGVAHEGQGGGEHGVHLGDVRRHANAQLLGRGLGLEAQASQRRAQIMGDGADHRSAVVHVAVQPVLHLVEGARRLADFRRSLDLQGRRVGIAAQPFGRRREGADRVGQPSGEQIDQRRHRQGGGQEPQENPLPPGIEQAPPPGFDHSPAAIRLLERQLERIDQHALLRRQSGLDQFGHALGAAEGLPRRPGRQRRRRQPGGHAAGREGREHHPVGRHAQVAGDALFDASAELARGRCSGRNRPDIDGEQVRLVRRQATAAQHLFHIAQPVQPGLGPGQGQDDQGVDQFGGGQAHQHQRQQGDEQRRARSLAPSRAADHRIPPPAHVTS